MLTNKVGAFVVYILFLCGTNAENYTLEELKHVFDYPDPQDKSVIYTDNTTDLSCANVTKLLLLYDKPVNLDFLYTCQDLEELWFSYREYTDRFLRNKYPVNFANSSEEIMLEKIHVNVRIGNHVYLSIVERMKHLKILDLSDSGYMDHKSDLLKIISAISSKLVAVSFDNCIDANVLLQPDFFQVNITEVFEPLRNHPLQFLSMQNNELVYINGHILNTLPYLRILDLRGNRLYFNDQPVLLEIGIFHPNIEAIYVTQHSSFHYQSHHTPVNSNGLDSMKPTILECLKKLDVTINQLLVNKTSFCMFCSCFLGYSSEWLLNHNFCAHIPNAASLLDSKCYNSFRIPGAPKLKEIFIENSESLSKKEMESKQLCFNTNSLQKATFINTFFLFNLSSVTGLNELKYVEIVQHFLFNVSADIMNHLPSLDRIKLQFGSINFLETELSWNISSLELSYDQIKFIPRKLLANCSNLKFINISGNELEYLDLDISQLKHLQTFDVSGNPLQYISQDTITGLKQPREQIINLYLDDIDLSCGCSQDAIATIDFLKNAQKFNTNIHNYPNLTCKLDTKINLLKSLDLSAVKSHCYPSNTILIIASCLGNMLLICLLLLIYLLHKCRYRIYTRLLRLKWKRHYKKDNMGYIYDAFVCYSAMDRFWVHDVLMHELEDKYGFKLCIHYRDFGFGDISEMIITKITQSRCTIYVLSNDSISSNWCHQELQVAYDQSVRHQKTLIIIKLGDIDISSNNSALVKQLLDSKVYIKWPDFSNVGDQQRSEDIERLFWAKLSDGLYGETESYISCCRSYFGFQVLNEVAADDDEVCVAGTGIE